MSYLIIHNIARCIAYNVLVLDVNRVLIHAFC